MSFLTSIDELCRLALTHYNDTYEFVVQTLNSDKLDKSLFSEFMKMAKTVPGVAIALYNIYTVYKLIHKCYINYKNKQRFNRLFNYNNKEKNKK